MAAAEHHLVAEQENLLYPSHSQSTLDPESEVEYELEDLEEDPAYISFAATLPRPRWLRSKHKSAGSGSLFHAPRRRRSLFCRIAQLIALAPYILLSMIVLYGVFFPSYTRPPLRYSELRHRVQELGQSANVHNEKIFIAASLYDHEGELMSGQWAQSVQHLIAILGPDNVYLSIYENDPDQKAQAALDSFSRNITCQKEFVTENLDLHRLPHVSTPDGKQRLKRIAFLADVRNRALRPLEDIKSPAHSMRFDKLLYLNDVVFDPIDAANLLFSTNVDETNGRTQYRATCAVDFINPFKFYDTFATRDLEGYDMGVPFYPWFSGAGKAESRKDVLGQKDAVRVKSCWGGMVAFEAKWFQRHLHEHDTVAEPVLHQSDKAQAAHFNFHADPRNVAVGGSEIFYSSNASLRFRAETDTYWDASECCLIHADLSSMEPASLPVNETGIYMNPYIRVAYSSSVLPWLHFTRRFERLYPPIHSIVDIIAQRPSYNPRQFQQPGKEVTDWVWTSDEFASMNKENPNLHGHFRQVQRTALPGGFCGMRKLLYINEDPSNGEGKWAEEKLPLIDKAPIDKEASTT